MAVIFNIIAVGLLITLIVITWIAPRRYGVAGMLGAHVLVVIGYFVLASAAIAAGRYEYDGLLSIFGLLIQAFLLNALLLPLAGTALWRRRIARR